MLAHPHMLRIYECLHNEKSYYIVSELMKNGELKDYMEIKSKKDPPEMLTEDQVISITKQILLILNYMH